MMRAAAVLALAGTTNALSAEYVERNGELLFKNFKQEYGRSYSAGEEKVRYGHFMTNMRHAADLSAKDPSAEFGANKFADLSADEFKVYHSLKVPKQADVPPMFSDAEVQKLRNNASASVDWRTKGAVTQVKDQAQCGSCWSFSSTGGIEGQWFLAGNKLTSVSEQELVACDKVDSGCNGGLMANAYSWLVSKKKGQIVTEADYPYTSGSGSAGSCKSVTSMSVGATITGHKAISKSESQMAAYITKSGPLPIAVDAQSHWQTYKSGILSTCTGTSLDHGVLAVGLTPDYWIVKNSWGPSWGESGYIRLTYGMNACGLTGAPTAPEV